MKVYFDYNATTPLDSTVLEAINSTLRDAWGNPSSSYETGRKAQAVVDLARTEVARMLGASSKDIIFTSGGTETNNWVINTALEYFNRHSRDKNKHLNSVFDGIAQKPHVVTTNIEHDSIRIPLEQLEERGLLDVTFARVDPAKGQVDVDTVLNTLRPSTCLVTVMLANNETGIIQPVEQIFAAIKTLNKTRTGMCPILTHTDAAQAFGKISVNAKELCADYMTIAGHKFYGPRIGVLYADNPPEDTPIYPFLFGGGQERNFRSGTRFRSGTENVGMIAGLGKAAQLVTDNVDRHASHMQEIRDYLESKLKAAFADKIRFNNHIPTVRVLPNTCSMSFTGKGLEGHKVLNACHRLEASVGAACHSHGSPSSVLVASGVPENLAANTLRLSVGRDTTKEDVDVVCDDLQRAVQSLTSIHKLGLKPEAEQTKALDYSLEKS